MGWRFEVGDEEGIYAFDVLVGILLGKPFLIL